MTSKKQITKLLMRLHGCAGWSVPLLLQITNDTFSQSHMTFYHERLESKMRNLIFVKYDITQTELLFAQSQQELSCWWPFAFLKINMVIIELYKPNATRMKYIGGKWGIFLNRKRLSYFILQEIPDLFSNLKCSNMQLYIRRWYIICMCKISVRNDIIKDI